MRGAVAVSILTALVATKLLAVDFTLTEEAAVHLAVERNLSLLSSLASLDGKRIAAERACGSLLPELAAGGTLSRSNQPTAVSPPGLPYSMNGSLSLGASLSLSPAAFQAVKTARLDYSAGRLSFEQAKEAVSLEVRRGFYGLILIENELAVSKSSISTAAQTLEQVKGDYQNGRVQRLTLRQAELSLRSAELVLRRQQVAQQNALASFKELLGVEPAKSVEIRGSLDFAPVALPAAVRAEEVGGRIDILTVDAQIELQRSRDREASLSLFSPTLTLSAVISPQYPDPFNPANPPGSAWNDRGSISVTLSAGTLLGFLPFAPQSVSLAQGQKTVESLQIRRRELVAAARTEIESLVRSLDASTTAIESLEQSVAIAQESYDLTREAYSLGTVDFLTLKSAEDDLLRARYDLVSERYTYLTTLISLEYATGLSLRGGKE